MFRAPVLSVALCTLALTSPRETAAATAEDIYQATRVTGGLVVHVGCGDGALTLSLRTGDGLTVHGLDTDPASVAKARETIRKAGLHGPVSVDVFDGKRLPYAGNLVSLVVGETLGAVPMEEVLRVLSPRGVAYVKTGESWKKTVKPVPGDIDDWPHYLHGADNNAVARDTVVAPPRRTQWIGGPYFARSHEISSSLAALVSSGGRLFTIWDDNPTGMTDKRFPADWKLIARDAFNGIVLWKRPMPDWGWREWHAPSRWDTPNERALMLRLLPSTLPRRLVAAGDRIYVTLGYRAPVSILDAATGKTALTIPDTALTDEILHVDGVLVLRVRVPESPPERDVWNSIPDPARARVRVVDAGTGAKRWESKPDAMAPLTLAARNGRIFYSDYERIVCLDIGTGGERWRSQPIDGRIGHRGTVGTLVAQDRVVLFTSYPGQGKDSGRTHALASETGKRLWMGPKYIGPGITNPPDLFVASGLVWIGESRLPVTHEQVELRRQGFDPLTGKVVREVVVPKLISWGHHYRCYRSKATERFLMLPKRGIEFVDLTGKDHMRHDWLRPPCIFGTMPANGLLYVAPHQCVCYQGTLLSNFNALAPKGDGIFAPPAPATRLTEGPAWGQAAKEPVARQEDWPAYRRDSKRSGATTTTVPDVLKERWRAGLHGRLTPPVVADGLLLVAERDTHTVHALNAETGKPAWHFTAGGRVDSPPTMHQGLVLFGAADGRVYCLRLQDGREVWRFQAAPGDRRVVSYDQVESAWPVHGSVLVQRDVAYVTAGRSSFLDGGIHLHALDPRTGRILHQALLDGPHPDPFTDQGGAGYMDGSKSDILVGDGSDLYLFQERFGADLKRHPSPMQKPGKEGGGFRVYPPATDRGSTGTRLMTTHGFLYDADNEGKYWTYGDHWPGWSRKMGGIVYGQLLVFDADALYGVHVFTENVRVRRSQPLGGKGPRLFARDHDAKKDRWSFHLPVRVRAMVLAGQKLFLAGPPDIVPPDDPLAAIQGRRGAVLCTVTATDGEKVNELTLDAPPVFDGLIAANGRLYLCTEDGRVRCLAGR